MDPMNQASPMSRKWEDMLDGIRHHVVAMGYGYGFVDAHVMPVLRRIKPDTKGSWDMYRLAKQTAASIMMVPGHPCPTEPGDCVVCDGTAWWDGERWVGDLGLWNGKAGS